MAKGVFFYLILLISLGLFNAPQSFACELDSFDMPDRSEDAQGKIRERRELCKKQVKQLLAMNESLAHLKQDSPLLDSDVYHFPDLVKQLLGKKAGVEVEDEDAKTPLHFAANLGFTQGVNLLLQAGANTNHASKSLDGNDYPLHAAVRWGYLEIAQNLLAHAANPNTQRNFFFASYSPLDEVVRYAELDRKNRQHLVRLLVANGADPERKNNEGITPLQRLKKRYENEVKCLVNYDKAWRYKGMGQMLVHYSTVKRLVGKIPIGQNNHLPRDIVQLITQFVFAGKENILCQICDKTMRDITTGCRHEFCNTCISRWTDVHKDCPVCHKKLINDPPPSPVQERDIHARPWGGYPGMDFVD